MAYLIKTPSLQINLNNIAGVFQELYDNNGIDGMFNFIKTEKPDEFLVAFHRETEDDFEFIKQRVEQGASLRDAIAQQLISELTLYNAPGAIADAVAQIVKQLNEGACEIQTANINEFDELGVIGGEVYSNDLFEEIFNGATLEEGDGERPH